MDKRRWDVDYPETTGYIIPTLLAYASLTTEETYRKRAIDMGDWEIAIQSPEGGAGEPFGVYGLRPRIFNTGQVLIGWISLFKETGRSKYLDAARKAGDWLVINQDADGKWSKRTYAGPKTYMSRVSWALMELFIISQDEKYRMACDRSVRWIMSHAQPNGWFAHNSLSDPTKPWTHLIGYVLVGLLKVYKHDTRHPDSQHVFTILRAAAKNLAEYYLKLKESVSKDVFKMLPGNLDNQWRSVEKWSCVTGNAQLEFFLRCMYKYTDDPRLKSSADLIMDDLKRLHMLDGVSDSCIYGGLPGSFPIGSVYLAYAIPNWGVKFFADSLLQRIIPENEQEYLG